jgi:small-conductance mechanosensitive channel
MKLDPPAIATIVVAILGLGGIVLTNRYAARSARAAQEAAQRQKEIQIDTESFKRARDNYDAALIEQERRIERLRREMDQDREDSRRESADCRRQIDELRRDLTALREWARPLLRAARAAGVLHPDPPIWLGADAVESTDPATGS